MPQLMQVEMMDPEEAQRLLEAKQAESAAKERARLAAQNRLTGHAKPEPGDRLYVTTARGIPQRSRAGCLFKETARTEICVAGDGDTVGPVLDEKGQPTGAYIVSMHSAEMIIADTGLNVTALGHEAFDASEMRKTIAAKDAEIDRLRSENARILREARQSAKDPGDGSPGRLAAARKAKAGLPDPDGGFGGKD
jgi:hypothetical protein